MRLKPVPVLAQSLQGFPPLARPQGHLLLTKYAVGLQFSLFSGLLQASAPQPPRPLLRTHGEQQHEVRLEQVPWPLVHRVVGRGQVLQTPTQLGGYAVGGSAVPEPEKQSNRELPSRPEVKEHPGISWPAGKPGLACRCPRVTCQSK